MSKFYKTLVEASEATIALGITSSAQYKIRYREDDKLPSSPDRTYRGEWENWPVFLGGTVKEYYKTLAEASAATIALGITSRPQYSKRYREDDKLPSTPTDIYKDEWENWPVFFGDTVKEYYKTLVEASDATIALGITSAPQYSKRYREDDKLPSSPDRTYRGEWENWPVFFGTVKEYYKTLAEASAATIALGITSGTQYITRYREDGKLPSTPSYTYKDEWENWPAFLGTSGVDRLSELELTHPNWVRLIRDFVAVGVNQNLRMNSSYHFLKGVIIASGIDDQPGAFLHKNYKFPKNKYVTFIEDQGSSAKRPVHSICIALIDFILLSECSDEDEDTGEVISLSGYRNPLKTLLGGLLDSLPTSRPDQSVKPVIPMSVIDRARKYLFPDIAKSLSDTTHLHELFSNDWVEIDENLIDTNDPNCVWRLHTIDVKEIGGKRYPKEIHQIWSPVRSIAMYALFQTPLRGQQIMWLDSGEGDTEIPIIKNGQVIWEKNTLPVKSVQRRMQGFLQKPESDYEEDKNELGMYVTTNKTGKQNGGYAVPWMPHSLAYWIIILRDWQAKYNPLKALTPWEDIKLRQRTNVKILQARGVQSFLFRDPNGDKFSPMMTTTGFANGLPMVLYGIQREGEGLAEKVEKKSSGVSYKSQFTPHSMRTSLITAYVVDGKAPIHIISKLVGHASIVMTIYYTKIGHTAMRKELGMAEKTAMKNSVNRYQDIIIDKQISTIKAELIATDKTFFDKIDNEWPAASYQFTDKWLCAMGGGACDRGGEAVVDSVTNKQYAPVPQGYLGKRNCIRCRFSITGPAFIGGLKSLANEILLEIESIHSEYTELEQKIVSYENEKYDNEEAGTLFGSSNELNQAQSIYEEKALKLDMYASDLQVLNSKIYQSGQLLNGQGGSKNNQLIVDNAIELGIEFNESETNFRLLANICSDAEMYTSASASRAAPLLATMLDNLADNNGLQPAMFRLNDKQKLKVANQITQLMMSKLNNDWDKADKLLSGNLLLEDLAIEDQLVPLGKSIESLMHGIEGCQILERTYD